MPTPQEVIEISSQSTKNDTQEMNDNKINNILDQASSSTNLV